MYDNVNSFRTHIRRAHDMTWSVYRARETGEELLACQVCGIKANNLNSHISRIHGMKPVDYKVMFPCSETCRLSPQQVAKMTATKRAKDSKNKQSKREADRRREETLATGAKPLQCQLCDVTSANSLISHITRKHAMSMGDYRFQFPGHEVQRASPSQKANNSKVMKNKLQDPLKHQAFLEWRSFPSEIKHWIKKGYGPREAHQKVAEFQQRMSLKGNNEVTRAKRSAKNTGSGNPMSLDSIMEREGVDRQHAHELTPCFGRTGKKHPMFGKKHTEEAIKKIGQYLNHSGRSKIEHELSNALIELYGGEKNAHVFGWCCDYVNRDRHVIVEFFGDFWHHNPRIYEADFVNKLTKRSSTQTWDHDARKLAELRDQGYEVIVIWESDWRLNREACMQRIKDAFDRTL